MAHILFAEEASPNTDLVKRSLKEEGHDIIHAQNGKEFLNLLQQNKANIDLILLDWALPLITNLGDLAAIGNISEGPQIPLIVQIPLIEQISGKDKTFPNEVIQQEAIYYLPKPYDLPQLNLIIQSALRKDHLSQIYQGYDFEQKEDSFSSITLGEFEVQSLEEMEEVLPIICAYYPIPNEIKVGIRELILNGIEHGNLGITYQEKGLLLKENQWREEIAYRQNLPQNINKKVRLQIVRQENQLILTITDEGEGFNPVDFLNFDASRISAPNGRGIAFANQSCFDQLIYNEKGNQVTAVKFI